MPAEPISTTNTKAGLSAGNAVSLKLTAPFLSRKYGFVSTLTTGKQTNEIKYEAEVTLLKQTQPDARLFSINRVSPVYINGLEPDLIAEQLAFDTGKVLYPLVIATDLQGRYLEVHNYAEICNRWAEAKPALSDYYQGEVAEQYIALMDEAMASKTRIDSAIRSDLLITALFPGLYKPYSQVFKIKDDMYLPVAAPALPARFTVTQQVDEYLNDYQAIEIHHEGTLNDDRSVVDFEQQLDFALSKVDDPDLPSAQGNYEALYVLEADTGAIESATVEFNIALTETKNFNLKLFKIENEIKPPATSLTDTKQPQLLIIDGVDEGGQKGNIFTKFVDSLFGK